MPEFWQPYHRVCSDRCILRRALKFINAGGSSDIGKLKGEAKRNGTEKWLLGKYCS